MPVRLDTLAAPPSTRDRRTDAGNSRNPSAALAALGRPFAGDRWLAACVAAAAVVLLAILARPLLTGRIPVFWDLGAFHLPLRDFYARCLLTGDSFDWMPGMYTGLFITGEGEHGPYHPLHWVLYRFLPLGMAFALESVAHYPFLLLGTFLFLRRHAGRTGALLGGFLYTFSANNLYHGTHLNLVAVMAHLPWLLWLLEHLALATGPARWLVAAGVALLTGSQALLGQPQAMSWSLLAEVLYAGFLVRAAPRPVQAGLAWGAGKALGLAVGGVQVLATLAFLANSNRSTFDPLYGAFIPKNFVQVLVPCLMARLVPGWWDEPFYFGAVAVILLAWWLTGRRTAAADDGVRRVTWFALVLGVLAAWLATGSYGKLYLVQTRLPLVGHFRAPSRYVNLAAFAAAVLAGVAFGRLAAGVRARRPLPWRQLVFPWLTAIAAVAAAVVFQVAGTHGWDRRFASGALAMVGAAGALTLAVRGRTLGLYGLILLAAIDLRQHALHNNMWGEHLWNNTPTLAEFIAAAEQPPASHPGRILSCTGSTALLHGRRLVNGYRGGIEPRKHLDYRTCNALRAAGAAWYRDVPQQTPAAAGLEPFGDTWYRIPDPLPRVRLVGRVVPSDDPGRDLADIDVEHAALSTGPLDLDGGAGGSAALTEDRPGRLSIETSAPGPRLLVVSESHDPGWQVRIDGRPATVERANGDFLGCVVAAGRHTVAFTFAPASIRWGRAVSLAGLGVVLSIAGWAVLRLRRRCGPVALTKSSPIPHDPAAGNE
jgi:hypothetical protein